MNAETLAQVRRLQEAARTLVLTLRHQVGVAMRAPLTDDVRNLEAAAEELDLFLPEQADPLLVASAADVQRQAHDENADLLRDDAHARRPRQGGET